MPLFPLKKKTTTRAHAPRFYCRHHNRLVTECPLGQEAARCPVRRTCPAYDGGEASGNGDRRAAGG